MLLKFKNEDGVDRKGEKKYMESDPDGDEMEEAGIDEKRGHQWRMVFE